MNLYNTYRYWRQFWLSPTATISAAVVVDKDTKQATFSFSFCSPKEKEFSRKKARLIAEGRMASGKTVVVQLPADVGISKAINQNVFGAALTAWASKYGVPRWTEDSLQIGHEWNQYNWKQEYQCACAGCMADLDNGLCP